MDIALKESVNCLISSVDADVQQFALGGIENRCIYKWLVKKDEVNTTLIEHFIIFIALCAITRHSGDTVENDGVSLFYLGYEFLPMWTVLRSTCVKFFDDNCIRVDSGDIGDLSGDFLMLGANAAIEAHEAGAKVMVVTKLRMGDANTMMAEGGIQAADKPNDSPATHFVDAFGGGHFAAKRELLKKLVCDAPEAIQWLSELGVEFDKEEDGTMVTTHGGGTSRKRMHAAKDYSGAEIMRTLRDEVFNRKIPVVDFTAAIELILDENGNAAGAVLMNMETKELLVAKAKTVVIATGGAGRMHYQGFPTSNHYGATADGLVLGYRAGAKLVNKNGEVFMRPLETRDVTAASIIRECSERDNGIDCGNGKGVWLDTPMIEKIGGEGTIMKRIPAMWRMFEKYGIDIRYEPILVYPTLHYQNGGLDITDDCMTTNVKNLFVAGEAVGGIHGKNRLMGNSLLDIIVFGRSAGKNAAATAKDTVVGKLSLAHIAKFEKEIVDANIETELVSPKLLPNYTTQKSI